MTEPLFDQKTVSELRENIGADQLQLLLGLLPEESTRCLEEIRAALSQGDLAAARRGAHRLKGVAGNIGACKVARLARELEQETETVDAASDRLGHLDVAIAETNKDLATLA